jgi:hypothetical protein
VRRLLSEPNRALAATAVLSAIGAVLTTWPLAREMGTATLRSGEVLLSAWQLNWYHHALLSNPLAWVDANIFFPYRHAATFNDLLLTHALVTLPAAWVSSPVLALNLALLAGIVLCGVCAHLLIVEVADEPWAATIGGTLFALAPFRFLHLGHLSIAAAWAVPLFLWALLGHLRQPSWRRAVVASAAGVATGLSSLYHAAYIAPIVPLVLLFGLRRGPGGRRTWVPLLVAGSCGLALLAWLVLPFAATMRTFGAGSAPGDLVRYGADLTSFAQKPDFLGGEGEAAGIDPEAHLYPGTALGLLAAAGIAIALFSAWTRRGWVRAGALALGALCGLSGIGLVAPMDGAIGRVWASVVLALIWLGPLAVMGWAIVETTADEATGPAAAIRLGIAGAAFSFVLALGPEARYFSEAIGRAPYWLLTQLSASFAGTRVPARFGGLSLLFLALVAAGALVVVGREAGRRLRFAGAGMATLAVLVCLVELPVPTLPRGRELVPLPELQDSAYAWIRSQPGRFGILELPDWPADGAQDWQYRGWRSLRYMLASKQHEQHLVNGTGRVEPFLWGRFRAVELWSDGFFEFIASYLPVRYVLVHEAGLPPASRDAVWARLDRATNGWRPLFRSPGGVRIYGVDRSAGRGAMVDRIYLRREVAPAADVAFSARVATVGADYPGHATLHLLRDGEPVGEWAIDGGWRELRIAVPVDATAGDRYEQRCEAGRPPCVGWPPAGVLFRWRTSADAPVAFEIRGLSIAARGARD